MARNVAVKPSSFNIRCLQELNKSTPAAHVLSVCAYFPNLDMGSELQAPRAYVKLAWLSPFTPRIWLRLSTGTLPAAGITGCRYPAA